VRVRVHTHTHTHTYIYTRKHERTYTYTYTYICRVLHIYIDKGKSLTVHLYIGMGEIRFVLIS